MQINTLVAPFFAANTYILNVQKQALVVDPGAGHAREILATLEKNDLEVGAVLCTHGHPDHVWDAAKIAGDKPVYVPSPDLYRMDNPLLDNLLSAAMAQTGNTEWVRPTNVQELPPQMLTQPTELVEGVALRAVPAPGHTEGSMLFLGAGPLEGPGARLLDNSELFALAADVIFSGSVGRTDLVGGDQEQMLHTLRTLQNVIDPATVLLSGHGGPTTMDVEKRTNPYLVQARIAG
ncbi:MAG: MBL fold metallo-hydrolase [Winkia neuii]|uniref:MBL fold metallo-hydrolase n=1 Tax=Winkia neuii TaxID=33007 RepID=UPI00290E2C98|nr:MBL fold metallo-hydrolase [Winkia neuii]MDU5161776.1 MBL fold metallo-hydrolase [Winkia neuii]